MLKKKCCLMTSVSNVHQGINKCLSASFGNLKNKRKKWESVEKRRCKYKEISKCLLHLTNNKTMKCKEVKNGKKSKPLFAFSSCGKILVKKTIILYFPVCVRFVLGSQIQFKMKNRETYFSYQPSKVIYFMGRKKRKDSGKVFLRHQMCNELLNKQLKVIVYLGIQRVLKFWKGIF